MGVPPRLRILRGGNKTWQPACSDAMARLDGEIVALKAAVEHAVRVDLTQFNKTSDRLDKVEKGQAEPAARLAKLSETV